MHRSLSIVLPVRNAQSTLRTDVCRLMDVMPDLAGPLEVLVIDDGSNDGTEEVAWELLTSFPQFDFIRNPLPAGLRQSLRTAYEMTRGHHLLIHCGDNAIDVGAVARRCCQRDSSGRWLVDRPTSLSGEPSDEKQSGWIRRVASWRRAMRVGAVHDGPEAVIRLVRRAALYQWLLDGYAAPRYDAPHSDSSKLFRHHQAHLKSVSELQNSAPAECPFSAASDD